MSSTIRTEPSHDELFLQLQNHPVAGTTWRIDANGIGRSISQSSAADYSKAELLELRNLSHWLSIAANRSRSFDVLSSTRFEADVEGGTSYYSSADRLKKLMTESQARIEAIKAILNGPESRYPSAVSNAKEVLSLGSLVKNFTEFPPGSPERDHRKVQLRSRLRGGVNTDSMDDQVGNLVSALATGLPYKDEVEHLRLQEIELMQVRAAHRLLDPGRSNPRWVLAHPSLSQSVTSDPTGSGPTDGEGACPGHPVVGCDTSLACNALFPAAWTWPCITRW